MTYLYLFKREKQIWKDVIK